MYPAVVLGSSVDALRNSRNTPALCPQHQQISILFQILIDFHHKLIGCPITVGDESYKPLTRSKSFVLSISLLELFNLKKYFQNAFRASDSRRRSGQGQKVLQRNGARQCVKRCRSASQFDSKPDAGRSFGSEVPSLSIFQKYARYAKKHVNNGTCVAAACPPDESKAYLHLNDESMLAAMQIALFTGGQ